MSKGTPLGDAMSFIDHDADEMTVEDLIFQQHLETPIGTHELFRVDNDNAITK